MDVGLTEGGGRCDSMMGVGLMLSRMGMNGCPRNIGGYAGIRSCVLGRVDGATAEHGIAQVGWRTTAG